jgi:hypothetical protein
MRREVLGMQVPLREGVSWQSGLGPLSYQFAIAIGVEVARLAVVVGVLGGLIF